MGNRGLRGLTVVEDDKPQQSRSTQIAEVKKGIASLVGVGDVKASQLMLAMTVLSRPEYAGTLQQLCVIVIRRIGHVG